MTSSIVRLAAGGFENDPDVIERTSGLFARSPRDEPARSWILADLAAQVNGACAQHSGRKRPHWLGNLVTDDGGSHDASF